MFKWEDKQDLSDITPRDLKNPIYGFFFDQKGGGRSMSVADSEGFSQFQVSLVEHKNDSKNVEYNPLDVFINAKKYSATKQTVTSQHKKQPTNKTGYQLFIREVRPIVQRRNPDVPFGTITKMVAQMWNELTPAEQEDYTQKAKNLPDGNDENQEVGGGGDMYFGMPPPQPPQDDGTGGMYNLGLGGQFQN